MATHPKKHSSQPLPVGLEKNGLTIWHMLSDKQRKVATDFASFDAEYHERFCRLMNNAQTDAGIIQRGGILNGLSHEGKKAWDMLEPDIQLEIFITSSNGNIANIRKFINSVWEQHRIGQLTLIQIEHGIQTLANEKKGSV
jgi:hypothetical protein